MGCCSDPAAKMREHLSGLSGWTP
uniref:Uncharacterized protein n=1 Tax=Arundo donax TaxID=35708 RepID=A0A0A9BLH9_ARUDO